MNSLTSILIQLGEVIIAVGTIAAFCGKWIKKQFEPITFSITGMDSNNCKCYLVNFLSDIEKGITKDEVQIKLAYEMYDHYAKDLAGNSYIHDKWEKLKNEF